jgi:hypothetical protein
MKFSRGRHLVLCCGLSVLPLCGPAAPAFAATPAEVRPARMLIFDYSEPRAQHPRRRVVCLDAGTLDLGRPLDVTQVRQILAARPSRHSLRWMDHVGDGLLVVVLADATDPADLENRLRVSYQELDRPTRLMSDISALAQLASNVTPGVLPGAQPSLQVWSEPYLLASGRSTLVVTAKLQPPAPRRDCDKDPIALTANLVVGPPEHFFITADLPVQRLSALKLSDGTEVSPRQDPSAFYVGLNYSVGDLHLPPTRIPEFLVLKAVARASTTRPLSSYGFGLALRGLGRWGWGLDLDVVTPFVLWTRTRIEPDGSSSAQPPYADALRWGVGFNLAAALKWTGN